MVICDLWDDDESLPVSKQERGSAYAQCCEPRRSYRLSLETSSAVLTATEVMVTVEPHFSTLISQPRRVSSLSADCEFGARDATDARAGTYAVVLLVPGDSEGAHRGLRFRSLSPTCPTSGRSLPSSEA